MLRNYHTSSLSKLAISILYHKELAESAVSINLYFYIPKASHIMKSPNYPTTQPRCRYVGHLKEGKNMIMCEFEFLIK